MELVISLTPNVFEVDHKDHNKGVSIITGAGSEIHFSLCPWCGASLLPKPIVVKTKYRGKR